MTTTNKGPELVSLASIARKAGHDPKRYRAIARRDNDKAAADKGYKRVLPTPVQVEGVKHMYKATDADAIVQACAPKVA